MHRMVLYPKFSRTADTVLTNPPIPDYVDLLVIGGGINGAGIAADAAGRGLSVLLCEQNDLASATSSASTKLIHGGLRYLETYQFKLVRESLIEREVLLRAAPHIVTPLRFRLPHHPGLRPAWMIRAGLFLYDHLGRRVTLPGSRAIRFGNDSPLHERLSKGFEYADCRVDDARLVILNALQARQHGAVVLPRHECVSIDANSTNRRWQVTLNDRQRDAVVQLQAGCVVNVAGPWVSDLGRRLVPAAQHPAVRLVKGSHIIVPRLHEGDEAYLLQHGDGRVVFVIPYQQQYSLIGTTEQAHHGDPATATISEEEIQYLLAIVGEYFMDVPDASQVLAHFAGVRPLLDDSAGEQTSATRLSRDYRIELHQHPVPLVTVYGGKLTTYRRLAEAVMSTLAPVFPTLGPSWTATATLPGGDFAALAELDRALQGEYPWLPTVQLQHWARRYGTLTRQLLAGCASPDDLGVLLGPGLYECEARYLMQHEWAASAEDILWRRTKLGLQFDAGDKERLQTWMNSQQFVEPPAC